MNLQAKSVLVIMTLILLLASQAQAMTLFNFGRLNNDDEAGYVAYLIDATTQMLKDHGQKDQADKILAYFNEPGKDGGVQQFAEHLKAINGINNHNKINPNNRIPELQVEDAMSRTLKDIGIDVPVKFLLTAGSSFKPEGLPRMHSITQ